MRKIPTIFERDWTRDKSRVLEIQNPACDWVFAGEGAPTRKLDGTSCMLREGALYRRREVKAGKSPPDGFEVVAVDSKTGKTVGWVPVGDGPEDKWHRAALVGSVGWVDGTYELVGPHVQGGIEREFAKDVLVNHAAPWLWIETAIIRTFDGIREYLERADIEGIVFHHQDGRMAKIKKRDFGLERKP